ncbi:signal peptidase II [Galbitalea sp. SE-J8]|uniref:signal peptidase II n=1 Tax=Galbitalea sp. SE-J8 TaxID=3054952 RepID=UPI00338EE8C1
MLSLFVGVAIVVYGLDQLAKFAITENLADGERVPLVGDLVSLHLVKNPGAAFSLLSGTTWVFAIVATAVAVFIVVFARRIRSPGWAVLFGLLLGGTTGNLTDRLVREPGFGVGHVVDFVQLWGFPAIFNVADMSIVASMALFVLLTLRGIGLDGRRHGGAHRAVSTDAPTDAVDASGAPPAAPAPASGAPDASGADAASGSGERA